MKVLAENTLESSEIDMGTLPPEFRRASLNMALATLNCERVLKFLPDDFPRERVSFVLGTHFGEVSTTLDFLSIYRDTNIARPILFQNSLHNSTLGFTSIHLGLTGPSMTISCDRETESSTMQVCDSLLNVTDYVLVCFVDSIPPSLTAYYLETYPFLKKFLNKSICLLLGRA